MKRIIALTVIALTLFSLSAFTYHVGLSAGGDLNCIIAAKGYRNYEYGLKAGFTGGADFLLDFTKSLSLESGITYIGRDYSYKRGSSIDYRVNNGFLILPVALRLAFPLRASAETAVENEDGTTETVTGKVDSGFSLFGGVGGYVGLWLYGKRSGSVMGFGEMEKVDEYTDLDSYNRFDAGVLASFGVGMDIGKIDAYVKLMYLQSLTDMNKKQSHGAYPIHNATVSLTLGVLWGINK